MRWKETPSTIAIKNAGLAIIYKTDQQQQGPTV